MPQLPRIVSNVDPQFAFQSIGAAEVPGQAVARVGGAVTDIGQQMLDQQVELARTKNLMESNSQAEDAATKFYSTTLQDMSIPGDKLASTVKTGLQTIHDQVAKNIKDPIVKLHFDHDFEGVMDRHVTAAMGEGFKRSVDDMNAQANTSIDTYVNGSATAPENDVDYNKAQIHGILQGQVAHGALSKVQAQVKEEEAFAKIDHAQALNAIDKDPAGAAELLRMNKWQSINPVEREVLAAHADRLTIQRQKDLDTAAAKLEAQQAKQLKQEGDHQFAVDLDLADRGLLTNEQFSKDRIKYSWGSESTAVFDRINGQKELPSIEQTRAETEVKVGQWPAAITVDQLDKLRRTAQNPNGPLNDRDWANFRTQLANKQRQIDKEGPTPTQQRAMANANVKNALGGTDAYAAAVSELNHQFTSNPTVDPIKAGDAIIEKFKPNAVNIKPFNQAMDKLKSAQVGVNMQEFNHMAATAIFGNPKLEAYQNAREKLLSEADKSHRIVGNDTAGAPDGTHKLLNDGRKIVILKGKMILE